MGQLSLAGLFENLALLGPVLLFLLIPIGFIASAWVTNSVFAYLGRDADEATTLDSLGTFILLSTLFTSYIYLLSALFLE